MSHFAVDNRCHGCEGRVTLAWEWVVTEAVSWGAESSSWGPSWSPSQISGTVVSVFPLIKYLGKNNRTS